jgi:hypothetical protein
MPQPNASGDFDATNPSTWPAAAARIDSQRDNLVKSLIDVAMDASRSDDDRRAAILLLGKLQTDDCFDFLMENLMLSLPPRIISGDEEVLLSAPCVYALYFGNWRTAQAVLSRLDAPKSDAECLQLASVLAATLGRNHVSLIVDEEIRIAPANEKARRQNLRAIKRYLAQR